MSVRRLRALACTTIAFALTGCASAGQAWRAGPAGIPAEVGLRQQMVAGQYGSALESLKNKKVAPADALLRHMYKGLVAMHAGQSDIGTTSMDRAWEIVYDRWTKRITDGAAAMLTGDGALPYDPGPAELMLIPYYGGLNWLAMNERGEAAVEARRLATLLERGTGPQPSEQYLGVMRYISGVMFEVAGERNDADVAYRNASVLLAGALPADTIPPDAAHGDVVVLIEDGFVARPEPAALSFWVNNDDLRGLRSDDYDTRTSSYGVVHSRSGSRHDWSGSGYRSVDIRWPVMDPTSHRSSLGTLGARAWHSDSAGGIISGRTIGMSVSDAVREDFERAQPARIARAIARTALREVELKGAEGAFSAAGDIMSEKDKKDPPKKSKNDDTEEKEDGSGRKWAAAGAILLGIGLLVAHSASQVLDQPDLRAWQLLPDRVAVARLRLPIGDHPIEVTRDGEAYSLGVVTVRPGSVTVLAHRWWPDTPGNGIAP